MKAITVSRYGGPEVLTVDEISKPLPSDDEVLIRVKATSLNAADWHIMRGEPRFYRVVLGLTKPKYSILGADVAGIVEAVGKNVTQFREGDEVFGDLAAHNFGAFAEYVCAPEKMVARKPSVLSFEEAASVPLAAATALHALRNKGEVKAGQMVAINGASGGVGVYLIQLAKNEGAEVTAVCSTAKTDQAKMLGADHVIDYTKKNFTRNGKKYDLIIGANGNLSLSDYKRALTSKGKYVGVGGSNRQIFEPMLLGSFYSEKNGRTFFQLVFKTTQADLIYLKEQVEAGKLKPVIDKRYSIHEIQEAMDYLEAGHAKGKIVLTVS
ncbi:NAD(P)-dependent alcohol dehydrogenase [Parachryseolinea silvisoli]|uniref:NAD(P)-dependent alcohol dehydrogenase n=1 Tax=Parachryseolinea silvisoli TaxID=2873601 RepID=UPI002265AEBD|nr:NAD(P)-dependent alcohol dehydrogenase [Parachryseolinea silvisoli]MCD9019173.1 NAD(P)-dependent alcohol dehydrogenase [Parachryseolinea silvisoli]